MYRFVIGLCLLVVIFPVQARGQTDCRLKAQNTLEIAECAKQEQEMTNIKLEVLLQEMKKRAVAIDASEQGYDVVQKLDTSQESFKKYVEDTCRYEAATYTTGTFSSIAYTGCKIELMEQRINFLEMRANQ